MKKFKKLLDCFVKFLLGEEVIKVCFFENFDMVVLVYIVVYGNFLIGEIVFVLFLEKCKLLFDEEDVVFIMVEV